MNRSQKEITKTEKENSLVSGNILELITIYYILLYTVLGIAHG